MCGYKYINILLPERVISELIFLGTGVAMIGSRRRREPAYGLSNNPKTISPASNNKLMITAFIGVNAFGDPGKIRAIKPER